MELKPCPFCGQEPRSFEGNLGWHIGCNNPYCDFQPSGNYDSERVAVWQWNKRDDKDLRKLVKRLSEEHRPTDTGFWTADNEAAYWKLEIEKFLEVM